MAVQRGNVQCVQGAYGESAFEGFMKSFILYNLIISFKFYFDLLNMNKKILPKKIGETFCSVIHCKILVCKNTYVFI